MCHISCPDVQVGDTRGVYYVSNRAEPPVQHLSNGLWAVANATLEVSLHVD
jgi:hypothetical protein